MRAVGGARAGRRGRPLELNTRRLQELQQQWITQRLSSLVARTVDRGITEWIALLPE